MIMNSKRNVMKAVFPRLLSIGETAVVQFLDNVVVWHR